MQTLNHKMCANCTDIKVWAKGASGIKDLSESRIDSASIM